MAKVHICDVKVLNNPCPFYSPFQYEIVFECIDEIPEGKPLTQRFIFRMLMNFIHRS